MDKVLRQRPPMTVRSWHCWFRSLFEAHDVLLHKDISIHCVPGTYDAAISRPVISQTSHVAAALLAQPRSSHHSCQMCQNGTNSSLGRLYSSTHSFSLVAVVRYAYPM